MKRPAAVLVLLAFVTLAAAAAPAPAAAEEPVVRAVLFFSPACGHCDYVVNDLLFPVWFPQYGGEPEWRYDQSLEEEVAFSLVANGTLEILLVNRDIPAGRQFYDAATEALAVPQERLGVPRLVVGDGYLVGSAEIPEQFPGIVEEGLAAGGIGWPGLPGLEEVLAGIPAEPVTGTTVPATTTTTVPSPTTTLPPDTTTSVPDGSATSAPGTTAAPGTTSAVTTTVVIAASEVLPLGGDSPWDRFRRDTVANSLAVAVLVLMILSLGGVAWLARRDEEASAPGIAVPLLALIGMGVAVYLAFIEASGSEAVCGPLGNCNAVQQSKWAEVLGIPVGIIGVAGYAVVLVSWAVARLGSGRLAEWAAVALHTGAVAGTVFSIYLTFLEPFVIGATCMWCLSSALIVTVLMWLTARPAAAAWERLGPTD
ncbi:MAG TPA: vitamin K epoxide reductase family protein [Acidimicrobiia bacterium]|nr:vitamin K epoxide reductase family protein [Acidimicrobiia bacterium]